MYLVAAEVSNVEEVVTQETDVQVVTPITLPKLPGSQCASSATGNGAGSVAHQHLFSFALFSSFLALCSYNHALSGLHCFTISRTEPIIRFMKKELGGILFLASYYQSLITIPCEMYITTANYHSVES